MCDDAVFGAIIGDFETGHRCDPWLRAVHSFCGSSNWRVGLDPSTVAHVSQGYTYDGGSLCFSHYDSKTNFANRHRVAQRVLLVNRDCPPLMRQDRLARTVYRVRLDLLIY